MTSETSRIVLDITVEALNCLYSSAPFVADIPIQPVDPPWLQGTGISLAMLRCDLIHPLFGGNKFFKLKYNLQAAAALGRRGLLSFGGPWSNHLHALAAAGRAHGFATIGMVRGEAPPRLNACLQDAADMGMQLHFLSRADYARKHETDFLAALEQRFGGYHLIPEGGANREGILGCREMLDGIETAGYSQVLLACGTGATMAGLVSASALPVTGIQVLKGAGYLWREVAALLARHELKALAPWQVLDEFHGGGYARCDRELRAFIAEFTAATGVPLEPVYSGKLLRAISVLVARGYFPPRAKLLVVHGGGLQGGRGWHVRRGGFA